MMNLIKIKIKNRNNKETFVFMFCVKQTLSEIFLVETSVHI